MRLALACASAGLLACGVLWASDAGRSAEALLRRAREALDKGDAAAALKFAGKAVGMEPKSARAHLLRGQAHEAACKNDEAVGDYSRALALDGKLAEAYQRRGGASFKLGRVKDSLADFDRYLELRPEARPGHWQRGISLYYLGRYDEGARQFASYQSVDSKDVENGVWHYLCLARAKGRARGRAAMLEIGKDPRVPMTEVYALFKGEARPADVLAAARAGKAPAALRKQQLFYADLYLGLYYDSEGDKNQALDHLTRAVEAYALGPYMWDVARVHRDLLRQELAKKGDN
jgi:lipoprotein NlpI